MGWRGGGLDGFGRWGSGIVLDYSMRFFVNARLCKVTCSTSKLRTPPKHRNSVCANDNGKATTSTADLSWR
jgi:hypothetical protein